VIHHYFTAFFYDFQELVENKLKIFFFQFEGITIDISEESKIIFFFNERIKSYSDAYYTIFFLLIILVEKFKLQNCHLLFAKKIRT
jgi:hypothetical protein